ncbi:Uma2 family endonuclease [Streptomyces candidus]|uniref:Uma2 family endonuclease n=1 Tax=Streptomyces candidus TaxID=67283 RepID=A0A7X0HH12_9ACTN|nr:Uma2 family endonuclease [Streptomyces candidus]MBB6437396.1 Uma2 family endonuclease [Streptomyces candidus]
MSVAEEHTGVITQDDFEELARVGYRIHEAIRLEFVNGKIGVKKLPDGDHGRMIIRLAQKCLQQTQGLWLHQGQGLRVGPYRSGNAIPDAVLAPDDAFEGQSDWPEPDAVLMVVEVTSWDSDTNQRDRIDKPRAYAETGIPVYLLVDRDNHELRVHWGPANGSTS